MKRTQADPALYMITSLRGIYARIAHKLKCDPSYVSRVARGERRSQRIAAALAAEAMRAYKRLAKAVASR